MSFAVGFGHGRTGGDPQEQFASPFSYAGNNPVMMTDPDGQLAWFVPIIAAAVIGGTSQGIHSANNGGTFGRGFWQGALIGAAAAATGIGASALLSGSSFAAVASGTASVGFGGAVGGGAAGGAISGGLNAAAYGGNIGTGIWQGALGGAIGAGISINTPGIITGALTGGVSGGLASGITAELTGGNFGDGFLNGAVSGAIMGGVYGGIAASQSKYERSILFGGGTKAGKRAFIKDLAAANDAYNKGVYDIRFDASSNVNGSTTPLIAGNEMSVLDAFQIGRGVKSRLRFNLSQSYKQLGSTFYHEFTHVSDFYSGMASTIYDLKGGSFYKTRTQLEVRAYMANHGQGYRPSFYAGRAQIWNKATNDITLYHKLIKGQSGY